MHARHAKLLLRISELACICTKMSTMRTSKSCALMEQFRCQEGKRG